MPDPEQTSEVPFAPPPRLSAWQEFYANRDKWRFDQTDKEEGPNGPKEMVFLASAVCQIGERMFIDFYDGNLIIPEAKFAKVIQEIRSAAARGKLALASQVNHYFHPIEPHEWQSDGSGYDSWRRRFNTCQIRLGDWHSSAPPVPVWIFVERRGLDAFLASLGGEAFSPTVKQHVKAETECEKYLTGEAEKSPLAPPMSKRKLQERCMAQIQGLSKKVFCGRGMR